MSLADRLRSLRRRAGRVSRSRRAGALLVAGGFVLSRVVYIGCLGVRFDAEPLGRYVQFVDPALLRTDLLRSLFYLPDQPPALNLFLGIVLKAFPSSFVLAFHAAFLAMGLAGALGVYFLARRLGCGGGLAMLLATALFVEPGTVLYEHWLFYAYPVAVLLVLAALGLHRLLCSGTRRDALFAFGAFALLVLTRGIFHLAVYLGILGGTLVVRRTWWRPITMGALVPTLLVCGVYAKHALLYRELTIGGLYRDVNLYLMQAPRIRGERLQGLRARGSISGACPFQFGADVDLDRLVRRGGLRVDRSGVPILDTTWKSTGATNWHSSAARAVAEACASDARAIRAAFPEAYRASLRANVERYFQPAIATYPFSPAGTANAQRLLGLDRWTSRILMLRSGDGTSWTVVLGLVLTAFAPFWFLGRWLRVVSRVGWRAGRLPSSACIVTLTTATLVSTAVVVILYSPNDQSRYRAEVMLLVWPVAAATLAAVSRSVRCAWRRSRRSHPTQER
jgi:hypothetical protein